ncbi:hypothetical protein FRB97_003830 [Tulasnella sp. 331]|nr:hypothetical protein FRB97_003830 [Tulasnella sp. 331]
MPVILLPRAQDHDTGVAATESVSSSSRFGGLATSTTADLISTSATPTTKTSFFNRHQTQSASISTSPLSLAEIVTGASSITSTSIPTPNPSITPGGTNSSTPPLGQKLLIGIFISLLGISIIGGVVYFVLRRRRRNIRRSSYQATAQQDHEEDEGRLPRYLLDSKNVSAGGGGDALYDPLRPSFTLDEKASRASSAQGSPIGEGSRSRRPSTEGPMTLQPEAAISLLENGSRYPVISAAAGTDNSSLVTGSRLSRTFHGASVGNSDPFSDGSPPRVGQRSRRLSDSGSSETGSDLNPPRA